MTSIRLHQGNGRKRLSAQVRPLPLLLACLFAVHAVQAAPDKSFDEKVGPLLAQKCLACHSDKARTSGFSVATRADLLAGGARRGPAVQPGKPDESVLIKVLRGQLEPRMPAGGAALAEDQIETIAAWIRNLPQSELSTAAPASSGSWAFKAPQPAAPPAVKNAAWVRNGIDNFVLRKLEENSLAPAPEASRQVLLRRAFFDLIGLPPQPAEVDAFLNDRSPNAYEKLIDRLLEDPRYGERWGRHWLDLARYADSQGFEGDPELSHAWRYRDYVIDSFNKDKPYDRFVKEQIAGDELGAAAAEDDDDDSPRRARPVSPEGQLALGFLRLGPRTPNVSSVESRQMILDEMTATVSSVFLGLTVKCAQCHDHKYDPIPQKDYYRLQAFFAPIELLNTRVDFTDSALRARMETRRVEFAAKLKTADENFKEYQNKMMAKLTEVLKAQPDSKVQPTLPELTKRLIREDAGNLTASQDTTFTEEEKVHYLDLLSLVDTRNVGIGQLRRQVARYEPMAHSARNAGISPLAPNRPVTHVLLNGEFEKLGEAVAPGFLSAITGNSEPAALPMVGFGNVSKWRSVLADWIASPTNPLTGRVMVNRIWQEHFGAGIVTTASDFGKNGARPTHPELLDWLAVQFVDKAWSIKSMHRLIMTSSAYRQSSEHSTEAAVKLDPSNTLLWRMNRQRLEGEALRDSILAVSGRLNPERGGPGIFPKLPDELAILRIKNRVVWEPENGAEALKRSVYIMQRRQLQVPFLNVMDAPALNEPCPIRVVSTTAVQALSMLNGELVTEESKHFAARVSETAGPAPADRIRLAFQLALSRPPEVSELQKAQEFLRSGGDLAGLCRILFNTNEFAYVR